MFVLLLLTIPVRNFFYCDKNKIFIYPSGIGFANSCRLVYGINVINPADRPKIPVGSDKR